MKKLLAIILSFLLIIGTCGVTSFATEVNVAKVGNTEYATIDEAIVAWTGGTTLTLLADVTLSGVVELASTEHHILDLGTYTMTAASGVDAFVIKACGTGSSEKSALTINADATNPGGINAGSKRVIYYKYADGGISTEDRPIIKINNGVFTGATSSFGTYGIQTIGTAARKCATLNISGGVFNCSIYGQTKSKLIISGGTFNYSVGSQGDSTCLRLISGGTFKAFGWMTADASTKFGVGTVMGTYNIGTYIDDNGHLVVGGDVITEAGDRFVAHSYNYSGFSSYLVYSSAATEGLYYTSVNQAFADNNKTTGAVTVYVDEIDMRDVTYKGTIVVPEGGEITFIVEEGTSPAWTVSSSDGAISYVDANGNELELIDGVFQSLNPADGMVAQIGDVYYATLAEAVSAANEGDTIVLLKSIVIEAGETLNIDKDVTVTYTSDVQGEDMITNKGALNISTGTLVYVNTDTTATNVTVSTVSCEPGSILNITGGVVKNNSENLATSGIYPFTIDLVTNAGLGDTTATISGGEVISTNYIAIRQFNNGTECKNTLTITDGKIYGAKRAIQVHLKNNAAYTTITGGAIEGGDYSLCLLTTSENITVSGGKFIGSVWYSGSIGFISGGIFDEAVTEEYCAEDYYPVENSDGTYGVEKIEEEKLDTRLYYVKDFKPANSEETRYGFLMTIGIDSLDYENGGCGFYLTIGGTTKKFYIENGVVWENLTVELPDKTDYITPEQFGTDNKYIMNHTVYFTESELAALADMEVSVQGFVTTFDGVEIKTDVFNCGTLED